MKRAELIILIVMFVFAVASVVSSIGGTALILDNERMPAHAYSNALAILLGVTTLGRIIMLLLMKHDPENDAGGNPKITKIAMLLALISILYVLGISYIGFYITTMICLLVLFLGFENWNKAKLKQGLVFSLGLCVLLFVVFHFLNIYLPDGILF